MYLKFILFFIFIPSVVLGNTLPKSVWLKLLSEKLPIVLCQMEPFTVEESKKCLIYTKSFTKVCIEYNEEFIPDMVKQPDDGRKWGGIIGRCVGKLYDSLQEKEYYQLGEKQLL